MSGTAFLEEIVTWDDEKRAEKVEEALPCLIICLENHKSHDEAIGILQILCQSFVPVMQQDQLEEKVFSRMSHQVCQLLDTVLEDLHEAATQDQDTDCEHLITLLQHVASVAQCVEECVKCMTSMADIHTCQVRSLMMCSFHVLKGSYSHCQESSSLYGDFLPALSDSLSLIFRTAHSLQMVLLNLLDKLVTPHSDSKEGVEDIAQVCADLFAVCRVVACLDLKLTISLWKALSKLAGPQAGVLYKHIDLSGMVTYLCDEINTGTIQLLQSAPPISIENEENLSQGDEKVFQKSLRILGFQMKVLVALVRDFHDYLSDCMPTLHKLLLYLNSVLPPSLSAPKLQAKHEQELRQHLCNATQPLASHLLNSATFIHCVLKQEDMEQKNEFASLLLQVMVMDGVAQASGDVVAQWLHVLSSSSDKKPDHSLLSAVLSVLGTCHVEVCLPVYLVGPPCEGKPNRSVSLYQYVVEHVCAFIASCPAKLFYIIEKNLLQGLLGSNPISSQAAADCWCFMARYGTAELCWHHTQQILTLVLHVRSLASCCLSYQPLTSLLARLVKFLTPQHQTDLVALLPAASYLDVWADLDVSVFSNSVTVELCQALLSTCFSVLRNFCHTSCPSVSQASAMIPAIQCLHKVVAVQTNMTTTHQLTAQQGATLLDIVSSLWGSMEPDPLAVVSLLSDLGGPDGSVRQVYLAALMTLTSDVVEQLEVKLLLQILTLAHKFLKGSASRELTLAILQLMQSLGRLKLPPSVEQGQILRKIGDMFGAGLTHPTATVQYLALESFTRFAEQTLYEAVVPDCLAQHDGLQDKVAAYLQKTPLATGHPFDPVTYLQNQHQKFVAGLQTQSVSLKPIEPAPSEPQRKRQRTDEARDGEQSLALYQNVLDDLESVTEKMEKLGKDMPVPAWFLTRSRSLVQRLSSCLDHR